MSVSNRGLLLFAFFTLPVWGAEQVLQLTPQNTSVYWTLTDPLHTVRGTFRIQPGTIHFDTETGKAGGSVTVDVKSGESGSNARDSRMHENVLESQKYPEAVFRPDRVEGKINPEGTSQLTLHGTLKIHGAEHEITMNAQTKMVAGKPEADLAFDIPYVAWGMKDPSNFLLRVGKTVRVNIRTKPDVLPAGQ